MLLLVLLLLLAAVVASASAAASLLCARAAVAGSHPAPARPMWADSPTHKALASVQDREPAAKSPRVTVICGMAVQQKRSLT